MEPPRGFSVEEFETRTAAVQAEMAEAEIDALLLTTEPARILFRCYRPRDRGATANRIFWAFDDGVPASYSDLWITSAAIKERA